MKTGRTRAEAQQALIEYIGYYNTATTPNVATLRREIFRRLHSSSAGTAHLPSPVRE